MNNDDGKQVEVTADMLEERRCIIARLRQQFPGVAFDIPINGIMTINGSPLPVERADRIFATNRALNMDELVVALVPEISGFLAEQNDAVSAAKRLRALRTTVAPRTLLEQAPNEWLLVKTGLEIARNPDGSATVVDGIPALVTPSSKSAIALTGGGCNKDMMPEFGIKPLPPSSDAPLLIDTDKTDAELIAEGIPVTSIECGRVLINGAEAKVDRASADMLGDSDVCDGPPTVDGQPV